MLLKMKLMKMKQRHKIIDSKFTPGVEIYDFVLDKVVVEINTNNKQIDKMIAEKAMEIMGYAI